MAENVDAEALGAIEGLTLYSESGCGNCHCNNGSGGCNLDAPDIREAPAELLRASLTEPGGHPTMLEDATDGELDDLASFLRRLGGDDGGEGGSAITIGFRLYLEGACVECHLSSGRGAGQGGFGVPIPSPDPDNVYAALVAPSRACHPLRQSPDDSPEQCRDLVSSNEIVDQLTDTAPPDDDPERAALSFFLNFIAPQAIEGVEPCLNRPGDICTFAGTGVGGFIDRIPAADARLYYPFDVTASDWDDDGTLELVIVDWNNHRIRAITLPDPDHPDANPNHIIGTIAGNGSVSGEGALYHPTDAVFDADGALITTSWHSQNIYRYPRGLAAGAVREQLAGGCDVACVDDTAEPVTSGTTLISLPSSSAVHPDGRIFFSESGCGRIRILDPRGVEPVLDQAGLCLDPVMLYGEATLSTLAGSVDCSGDSCEPRRGYDGDGATAVDAIFDVEETPSITNFGIYLSAEDAPQYLYIADSKNNVIRRVNLLDDPPTIELFAGQPGTTGFADGDRLEQALFNFPANVYVAPSGVVYVADARNHAIRAVNPDSGEVTTVAGTGRGDFNGDNLPATDANLNLPGGVWLHPDGRLFIADTLNHRVRVVCPEAGCPPEGE